MQPWLRQRPGSLFAPFPRLTDEAVAEALSSTTVPGRLEVVRTDPMVLLDGAHNPLGAERLAEALHQLFAGRPVTLVCGISKDKPARDIVARLAPAADRFIATEPSSTRLGCWPAAELVALAKAAGNNAARACRIPSPPCSTRLQSRMRAGSSASRVRSTWWGEVRATLVTRPAS